MKEDHSKQFAEFVVDHLTDSVYLLRRDGSFAYVNQGACRMLGYTREQLLAKTILDVHPTLDQDQWGHLWRALMEEGSRTFQSTHRTSRGESLTVDISAHRLEVDGEEYSCAIARDVSAIRPIEQQRQREHIFVEELIEMAPVLLVLLDGDANVLRLNCWTERITGYARGEVLGKNWVDTFIAEHDRAKVRQLLERSFAGEAARGEVYSIVTKSGDVREVIWYDQLVSRADAAETGLLVIGQDVTEQRKLEQRLRQAEKMEAVGMLAGGIAHDFNNQLTGILGWAEIIHEQLEGSFEIRAEVERIIVAAKRARDVVTQVLAYSRKGKLITKRVNVHDLIEESVAMLRRGLDPRITIVVELEAEASLTTGDPSQLGNAVLNLGLNARDAMPDGGTLTFATRNVTLGSDELGNSDEAASGEFVELLVKDTGIGMDEVTQRNMFDPFFTTKGEKGGTGMGLAAVHGTVKNHRGVVRVSSAVGAGTEMRIFLPVVAPAGEVAIAEVPHGISVQDRTKLSLSLMVIDDDTAVRDVAVLMLGRLGCHVKAFGCPFDAIDYYAKAWQSVDAIILDMVIPLLDGKSTYYALRKINPAACVILVSGYSVEGAAQSLLKEGVRAFVQKPFTFKEIRDVLLQLPRGQRSV